MILYEKDNLITNLLKQLPLKQKEQIDRIVYIIKKLGNRGITYKGNSHKSWEKYEWEKYVDYWIERKDIVSAMNRLNECLLYIYELLFLVNDKYVPSSKWRYNIVNDLEWLPVNFNQKISKAIECELTKKSYYVRVNALREILTDCIDYVETKLALPSDLIEYYEKNQGINYFTDNTEE